MTRAATMLLIAVTALVGSCTNDAGDEEQAAAGGEPSMCVAVSTAMENGDVEWLARLGLPATMDVDVLAGDIDTRLCASDDLTGEYVMAVSRTSGQIVIVRNTTRSLLAEEPPHVAEAIDRIGTDLGVRLVEGESVVRLRGTKTGVPADPIGAILR